MSIINYVFHVNNHKGLLVYYRKHACKSCQMYLSKKFLLSSNASPQAISMDIVLSTFCFLAFQLFFFSLHLFCSYITPLELTNISPTKKKSIPSTCQLPRPCILLYIFQAYRPLPDASHRFLCIQVFHP